MRDECARDYHEHKVVSLKAEGGQRFMTASTSWLVATTEMDKSEDKRLRKACKNYIPSSDRLTNMVKGERRTINMAAILYPRKDNIVRVGRHNARVDEGLNEVVLLNGDAIKEIYGDWLTVIDSVANGEAFIIVRNNSEQAMRLSPGALEIAIRPALCLPRILTPCEVKSLQYPNEKEGAMTLSVEESEKGKTSPASFMSWNMNGLSTRMKKADLEDRFYKQLKTLSPDVVSLQEVRLACEPDQPDKVKADSSDGEAWEEFYAPLKEEYRAYLTLSASKYGGQAVLVKRTLAEPEVLYKENLFS
jgi:hypothetical protein